MIPIDEAMTDPNLFAPALGDPSTWATWRVILRAAFGLGVLDEDRETWALVAGGREPPAKRVRELWVIAGRRGGKSRMAALVSAYAGAILGPTVRLAPGEDGIVLAVGPTTRQAKRIGRYASGFLKASPILAQQIQGETTEEIRLAGDIIIATRPANHGTIRGDSVLAAVFEEAAFWRSEESATPDLEIYRAVLPALATTGGMLIGISSPYRKVGLLHAKHRDHFGKDDDEILVVQAPSRVLNPTLDETVIARARSDDAEAARAEWDAEFRSDLAALLDDRSIDAAIDEGRPLELPPVTGRRYVAFADASAGRHDAFTLGIGHVEDGVFVADVVRGRKPPFDPESVAQEYAALAKGYGVRQITGDAYAGEWVKKAFEKAGVSYRTCPVPKSVLYLEGLPSFSREAIRIPNIPLLTRELRLLERRTSKSGRDVVDHPQNGSDDHANALFGALYLATSNRMRASTATVQELAI